LNHGQLVLSIVIWDGTLGLSRNNQQGRANPALSLP
jgi:hypothetical protein